MSALNTTLDRRSFVSGAATAALAAAGTAALAHADEAPEAAPFETTVDWDAEYDVIVVGFGGAGASTAITAADEGAKVLILEKAPAGYSGGNSNVCMQWICYASDKEKITTYFKQLRGQFDEPSDEMLDVYIDGMLQNKEWLESLGGVNVADFSYQEFPDFEGVDAFTPVTTNGYTGIEKPTNFGGDGATYNLLKDNVLARADMIDIWYEAPGKHLIQDPATKVVHGVVAEVAGQEVKVRAKNGVVLTCGGYENNPQMQQDYNDHKFYPSLGRALYNTGDGIKMAMEIGADLWHMGNIVTTNGEFFDPETQTATFVFMIYAAACGMVVGADGTRLKEDDIIFGRGGQHHGKVWNHGIYKNAWLPDDMYYIFDQGILDQGQIHSGWSPDGSDELAKGWIIKCDTLEELGEQFGLAPEAVETMLASVEQYNAYCEAGEDLLYGRTRNLDALVNPPYYGIKLTTCTCNTQGGPRRGIGGEIIDVNGNPIPHLYESGELGDVWSNLYQASCNLGGGCIFGRISGKNAAAVKDDSIQDDLVTGGFQPVVEEPVYDLAENQYIGCGRGKGQAPIKVRVTMDGDKIADVEVLEQWETTGLLPVARALEAIPAAMAEAGSMDVDMVTSATRTSVGIFAAVVDALAQAGA